MLGTLELRSFSRDVTQIVSILYKCNDSIQVESSGMFLGRSQRTESRVHNLKLHGKLMDDMRNIKGLGYPRT